MKTVRIAAFGLLATAAVWSFLFAQDWMVCLLRGDTATIDTAEIQPGQQARFTVARKVLHVGTTDAFPLEHPLAGLQWSVEPAGQGIAVTAEGVVTASGKARPGTYQIVASAGGQSSRKELTVYRPSEQPLVGTWTESAQVGCGGDKEAAPAMPIGELIFRADGGFSVTWMPFETRKDYGGTYQYASGKLALNLGSSSNYRPEDIRPAGSARLDAGGRLVLGDGLWLGMPPRERPAAIPCAQIFRPVKR